MRRKPTTLRLSEEEIAALKRAADAEKMPAALLARVVLTKWLAERGYLAEGERPAPAAARRPRGRRT